MKSDFFFGVIEHGDDDLVKKRAASADYVEVAVGERVERTRKYSSLVSECRRAFICKLTHSGACGKPGRFRFLSGKFQKLLNTG